MSYEAEFIQFWESVKESAKENRFAKLTMAKTIGKPALRNIFVRPTHSENEFKVLVKLRYRSRDTADIENEMNLNETFKVLKSHLKNPFYTVLLFTTTEDITFKINKKDHGSIIKGFPSFSEVVLAEKDEE